MTTLTNWIVFMIVLVFFGIVYLANAEYYKFVDKDGNVQFTDNLDNVPPDQRNQVQQYEEVTHEPRRSKTTETDEIREDESSRKGHEDSASGEGKQETEALHIKGLTEQQLKDEGEKLREEYEALMEEKAALDTMAKKRLTKKLREKLINDIERFNERIKDYEIRRKSHNKAIEARNAQVKKEALSLPVEQPTN